MRSMDRCRCGRWCWSWCRQRGRGEQGSVLPLVVLLAFAIGGLCLAMGHFGGLAGQTMKARPAADAAALAGAADGCDAAAAYARSNGGSLLTCDTEGDEVQVRGRVGRAVETARAAPEPVGE